MLALATFSNKKCKKCVWFSHRTHNAPRVCVFHLFLAKWGDQNRRKIMTDTVSQLIRGNPNRKKNYRIRVIYNSVEPCFLPVTWI
jgi:hypothetical protein